MIKKIDAAKELGEKFSITLVDEWTNIKMKRFMNINIHTSDGKFNNLGVARIHRSCDAEKTKEIVRNHLFLFNLNLESDIVACTSDGAPEMVKFGKESPTEMQLCYNHTIHLRVMDAIGSNNNTANYSEEYAIESDDNEIDEYDENVLIDITSETMEVNLNFYKNLDLLRKCVKYFRNSTVKNNILQIYVKKEYNRELELILDCKTRWNSIAPMIERALLLKKCVCDCLTEMNATNLFDQIDFD